MGNAENLDQTHIRKALESDFVPISELNDRAGDSTDFSFHPGDAFEIKSGISSGTTFVLVTDGQIVGFYQYEILGGYHLELISIIVEENARSSVSQPSKGYAQLLISHFLSKADVLIEEIGAKATLSVVTSLDNTRMIAFLIRNEFLAVKVIPEYFGPGKDRVYLEHRKTLVQPLRENTQIVPSRATKYIGELLNGERYISRILRGAQGVFVEISKFD